MEASFNGPSSRTAFERMNPLNPKIQKLEPRKNHQAFGKNHWSVCCLGETVGAPDQNAGMQSTFGATQNLGATILSVISSFLQRETCFNGSGKNSRIPLMNFVFGKFGSPGFVNSCACFHLHGTISVHVCPVGSEHSQVVGSQRSQRSLLSSSRTRQLDS